jgi:glycine/D-amino acid oxidase-like deaminating enzyme
VERDQPVRRSLSRRQFLSAALVGLTSKSGRIVTGGFVNESHVLGHRLRDGHLGTTPPQTRRISIVIVGGGVAGLSAAWRLRKRGVNDFVLLEMEPEAGGNSRWGENDVSAYPWAAHYVPVPGPKAVLVRELFEDLDVLDHAGWSERHLCHAPQERLFLHGQWQEGLEPQVGPARRDRDQFRRFDDRIAGLRMSGEFTVPLALGAKPSPLDSVSMSEWLRRERLDSSWLRWSVDYACRDDYGADASAVSAWAGIHYFAAREPDEPGPLTWPEGNGWIVRRLLEQLKDAVHTSAPVTRVRRDGSRWRVVTPQAAWLADAVIFAAPSFLASRVIEGGPALPDFEYSPWLTANLTLDRWPAERGVPIAWDNVIFDSPALGYVVATHQTLRAHVPRTVWTYYWALTKGMPAENRRWLLAQEWTPLKERILDDLSRAHRDIRDCVTRVDVMRMGHAMIRPTVGFLGSATRRSLHASRQRLWYAHSDVSGLSLFEEAQYRGVTAADAAMKSLG